MPRKYIQGRFTPNNPQKYRGDCNNIIFRSSWEKRVFLWADQNPSVIEWSSEEIQLPYICETDNRPHRYFVDMHMKIRNADGSSSLYLVEIKPYAQTLPPVYKGKQTRQYVEALATYVKNKSKWSAAHRFAEQNNAKFVILTEKDLGIGNGRTK